MCLGVLLVLGLTVLNSIRYITPLQGVSGGDIQTINTGWYYEEQDELIPIEELPCSLDVPAQTLYLTRELADVLQDTEKVITFNTRYASIRVWADGELIYESPQGKEYALGSMWHFIPMEDCKEASAIRVELTKYENDAKWDIASVYLDEPEAIRLYFLHTYALAILFFVFCMLFTFLLVVLGIIMKLKKTSGVTTVMASAAFVFLSGQWVLLDSKITTVLGGNYALTYFFSYFVFYILMVPFLIYIQSMLEHKNRILRYLPWAFILNAAVCMGLHLAGIVGLRKTTITVHILILAAIGVSTVEFFRSIILRKEKKLICTFGGIILIYIVSLASIIMYYSGNLIPTYNSMLYSWGLLILIFSMTLDVILFISQLWREKQEIEKYRLLAVQDNMTMLGNRNAYEIRMKKLIADPPQHITFAMLDVNNLKDINDTHGHHVGDQVIYIAAKCLREIFEPIGKCYRFGGDEFCIILTQPCNMQKKLAQFDSLFKIKSKEAVASTVSYGWAEQTFDENKEGAEELIIAMIKKADMNLYRHKRESKKNKEV